MNQLEQFLETLDEQGIAFETISGQGYYEIQFDGKVAYFSAYTKQRLSSKMMEC